MALRVDLTGNQSGFQQMLERAQVQARAFSNSVGQQFSTSFANIGRNFVGLFAAGTAIAAVKSGLDWFVNTGSEIKEQAEQVQMSADSWQKWTDAVDRAHLSGEGFMRVVEALRQKRTDALTDPKARGELSRLGFSDADITGNMDMDTFLQRALSNASGGDLQRKYLADIIGNKGLKFGTVLNQLPNAEPMFSDQDLENAAKAKNVERRMGHAFGRAWVNFLNSGFDFFTEDISNIYHGKWDKIFAFVKPKPTDGNGPAQTTGDLTQDQYDKLAGWINKGLGMMGFKPPVQDSTDATESKDPLDNALAAQRDQLALKQQDRQQRLLDTQRALMTIGDRRASIAGEMAALQSQIADRTAKMAGEDFLTDAQKDQLAGVTGKAREFQVNALRDKFQEDTDSMMMRLNRDRGDLKEKPLNFNVDTLSKVGLYSASNVAFNPLVTAQTKANQLLAQIAHNTSRPAGQTPRQSDPHAP